MVFGEVEFGSSVNSILEKVFSVLMKRLLVWCSFF